MVTIKKGDQTITVTRGAYLSSFKAMGFVLVEGSEETQKVSPAPDKGNTLPETQEDSEELEEGSEEDLVEDEPDDSDDLDEKPLSEMTFEELQRYAKHLGLATAGVKSKRELRSVIRRALAQ